MENIDVAMTIRTVPVTVPGREFESFLFASIGEDGNGMQVSVLSGLARSDLDPWQEAAKLAALPGKTAAERLAALIETVPGRARSDDWSAATRLIALLPRKLADNDASGPTPNSLGAMIRSRSGWVYLLLLVLLLVSQIPIASRQTSSVAHRAGVHAVGEAAPPQPLPPSGQ